MKRILFTVLVISALIFTSAVIMPYYAQCKDDPCCDKCREQYEQCSDNYARQLYSSCHATCGKKHAGDRAAFSACLDRCYGDVDARLEAEGAPHCDSALESCAEKCGGCLFGE